MVVESAQCGGDILQIEIACAVEILIEDEAGLGFLHLLQSLGGAYGALDKAGAGMEFHGAAAPS